MMPMLFVILLLLLVRSVTLPGAMEGVTWYLKPDFSKLTGASVLAALGQSFFSIGIGMAGGFGFGSYLHQRESDVLGNAAIVVTFDTTVAFLAGLVLFPALFAAGLEPNSGPGLLFVTLPNLFNRMPAGSLFGGAFFFLVFLAGVTSAIALMEVLSATLTDAFKMTRKVAVWLVTGALVVLQIPVVLSQGRWADIKVMGRNFFDLSDFVSGSVLLPVGGLLVVLYAGWAWGFDRFREETNVGPGRVKIPAVWRPIIKFVIPAAVLWILLSGLGVL
jgi:NSS family neurotransmitter:Na+ symporter